MINPFGFISKFIKSGNQKELDRIGKIVSKVNLLEKGVKNLINEDFPKKTMEFKEKIKNGQSLNEILPEAFALVREASCRTRNERHYDVQIIGGVVLHESKIAEILNISEGTSKSNLSKAKMNLKKILTDEFSNLEE